MTREQGAERRKSVAARIAARDARVTRLVCEWFVENARELPWRVSPRDPWATLVSEIMLQQTQVSRVVARFGEFMREFPTPAALAACDETRVMTMWNGLGYYRRARLLHAAARAIKEDHGGEVPAQHEQLLKLPGIGRYTAGAISSIAFAQPKPIVDGNVKRVVLRLEGRALDPKSKEAEEFVWKRADELVTAAKRADLFNEGLMELGATVCTPTNPNCPGCPVAGLCVARERGEQERIPASSANAKRKVLHQGVAVIRDSRGRTLVERRPEKGLWAGMWQAITIEREGRPVRVDELRGIIGSADLERAGGFTHLTTHREVRVRTWEGRLRPGGRPRRGEFLSRSDLAQLPMSNPQRRLLLGETLMR